LLEIVLNPYDYPFWVLIAMIITIAVAIFLRFFSTYASFVYPNAKYEAIGNPFITESELNKILDVKNLLEFKDKLKTIKDYDVSGDDTYTVQQSLDKNFIQTIEMMRKDNFKKMNDFYNAYLEKMDSYFIKNVLKNKLEGKEINENIINEAILSNTKNLLQKIKDSEKQNLPEILKTFGFDLEVLKVFSDESIDYIKLDITIDKYFVNKLKKVKVPYKCDKAKNQYIGIILDVGNIKNVLRLKQLGFDHELIKNFFLGEGREIAPWKYKEISESESVSQVISSLEGTSYYESLKNAIEDYNTKGSVQVLENALDAHFLKLVKNISIQNYVTIGPTIRFLVSKEFEIKNLKIILKGIVENLSSDIIKPLLIMEVS